MAHDEASMRRLVGRFPDPQLLAACYEAGPTGYNGAHLLHSMGVRCQVIAPSLSPMAPVDKVKPDRRHCRRLARLYRAAGWYDRAPFADAVGRLASSRVSPGSGAEAG
jgi:transposase